MEKGLFVDLFILKKGTFVKENVRAGVFIRPFSD
jgi:hypothetical protein